MAYQKPLVCRQGDLLVQHVLLRKWGDGLSAGHLAKALSCLLKTNDYNHTPLYVDTWVLIHGSVPVWCVQVMLFEKQLSYGVHVLRHPYRTTLQPTLDAGVHDATHQALIAVCHELRDLDNQQLRGKEKEYVQKIEDLQTWKRVQEQKFQTLQALNSTQEAVIQSLRGGYGKFVKM
jgi:hypothetical protein